MGFHNLNSEIYLLETGKKENLSTEEVNKIVAESIQALNKELPAYSQIATSEMREEPFEKTPKQSIRRFMYS